MRQQFFFFLAFCSKHLQLVQVLLIESAVIFMAHEMRKINFSQAISQSGFYPFHLQEGDSTEAVPTGKVRHTLARVLKLGHIVSDIELVDNSFNCSFIPSFG